MRNMKHERREEDSCENLSMPVDFRVDFEDPDNNTYQSEDGMNDDEVSEVSIRISDFGDLPIVIGSVKEWMSKCGCFSVK